ncbi:hypothetical protein MJO28_009771 [Puccinia striiformis f. sp. tritici]|uniref:Uncharacterized protein n=1 Tax=Puccinia striiformis f. sp. tritici TaxID=168172 RepID=A0ACC0E8V7_9BASI|nr:hypothetical protein MJO28_009771 [Puccinia striiformis f. sp. tritici]
MFDPHGFAPQSACSLTDCQQAGVNQINNSMAPSTSTHPQVASQLPYGPSGTTSLQHQPDHLLDHQFRHQNTVPHAHHNQIHQQPGLTTSCPSLACFTPALASSSTVPGPTTSLPATTKPADLTLSSHWVNQSHPHQQLHLVPSHLTVPNPQANRQISARQLTVSNHQTSRQISAQQVNQHHQQSQLLSSQLTNLNAQASRPILAQQLNQSEILFTPVPINFP